MSNQQVIKMTPEELEEYYERQDTRKARRERNNGRNLQDDHSKQDR